MDEQVKNKMLEANIDFKVDVNLSQLTHTKTGGVVKGIMFPKNIEELQIGVRILQDSDERFEVLSGMTNVAVASGELDFWVLSMAKFEVGDPNLNGRIIEVSASYEMKQLTKWAYKNNVRGLEWMEGIPGTVGAGVYMNAGFLIGQDMEHSLVKVDYFDLDDFKVKTILNQDLKLRYRYSLFQDMSVVILKAQFLVTRVDTMSLTRLRMYKSKRLIDQYHNRRAKNQPLELPSAGTVFVPPTPWHVGGLLREMNLVGYQIGGAQISPKSPGFIVSVNNMTGEDYYNLVRFIQKQVHDKYGLTLEPEVRLIGFD